MADAIRVPSAPAPEFFAGGGVVAGDAIAADDQDFFAVTVLEWNWGTESLQGLLGSFAGAHVSEEVFAGGWVHREKERFAANFSFFVNWTIALQHLQVQLSTVQKRARSEGPLKGEIAIISGDAALPEFFSSMIERHERAITVKEENSIFVGDR